MWIDTLILSVLEFHHDCRSSLIEHQRGQPPPPCACNDPKIPDPNHLVLTKARNQDQPLLRVPYELHRRTHKAAQRNLEHDRDWLTSKLKSAPKSASPDNIPATLSSIDDMLKRMETLKRKLSTLATEEEHLHRQSRARLQHAQELESIPSTTDAKYDDWSKIRLNRLLVDYLLRSGYVETAQKLAKSQNIEDLVDVDAFVQCQKIEASLACGETKEALAWCADNKQALKKMNSSLEYDLRLQEYIGLVRTRDPTRMQAATAYARKYIAPYNDLEFSIRAAGLLAFGPNTQTEPYKTLYAPERWEHLRGMFWSTYYSLSSLPKAPPLHIALSAGLSALKTPSCHSSHMSPSSALNANTITSPPTNNTPAATENKKPATKAAAIGQSVCPICSTELNALARSVPYAHHSKSIVENDPVVLPNGRLYGRERLMAFQNKVRGVAGVMETDGGREEDILEEIVDPADTEQRFRAYELKKVFIM